jgi:probable HAF family extracellular repeat protein
MLASLRVGLRLLALEDRTVPSSFQGLGYLPGGVAAYVYGVSPDGLAAVGWGGDNQAFRWTAGGGMVQLGVLPGATDSYAYDASEGGAVITGVSSPPTGSRAFRWTAASGMVSLGTLFGDTISSGHGISADGSVIVGTSGHGGITHGFRWTANDGMTNLNFNDNTTVAFGVSTDGSFITGGFDNNGSGIEQAFRWTATTGLVGLGQLPGGTDSFGKLVSADGSVIVGIGNSPAFPAGQEAFRWTAAGGMVGLGALSGGSYSEANGMSDDGSVVVGEGGGAWRWTPTGGMRDLRTVLVNDYGLGTALAGWTLTSAFGCSADGRVIIGRGTDPAGQNESWIARLDAPPHVVSTQVNDGSAQRSRVTSLTITFSTQVSFASTPGAAFTLTRISDSAPVGFTATASIIGGVTIVTLNGFTGSATQFGSLADGRYTLTALASQISAGGQQMTSDYTFGDAQGLYRFFGDIDGDRHVDIADFAIFSNSFNSSTGQQNYLAYLDFNGDGHIDIADFGQFSIRFFTVLP